MGMNLDELEEAQQKRLERHHGRNFQTLWDQTAHDEEHRAAPLDVTNQVFGQKDYIPNPRYERLALPPAQERWTHCTKCDNHMWAMSGTACKSTGCTGVRFIPAVPKYCNKCSHPEAECKCDDLVDPRMQVIGDPKPAPWRKPVECNAVSGYWEMCERGTVGCTNHRRSASRFFRCYIHHFDNMCRCSQPVIVDWMMLDNAENAAMFVLGILKGAKSAKLGPDDVAYLAHATTKIMAHWARKALGHKPEDEVDAAPVVPIPHSD